MRRRSACERVWWSDTHRDIRYYSELQLSSAFRFQLDSTIDYKITAHREDELWCFARCIGSLVFIFNTLLALFRRRRIRKSCEASDICQEIF